MTDPLVTFVTPIAMYHLDKFARAKASVEAQTIKSAHISVIDENNYGAGWARNFGLSQVQTPFLVFLDADDQIDPHFAEYTLSAWKGDRYVYTDWYNVNGFVQAPDCAWSKGTWHVITALLPTAWVQSSGGFDTRLPAFEDTDFYMRLTRAGYCGRRLPMPLFTYSDDGQRAAAYYHTDAGSKLITEINSRYTGLSMKCCGQENVEQTRVVVNEPKPGYVLARVTERAGQGGHPRRGLRTGNIYEYAYVGDLIWVDPGDADHPAGHFERELPPAPSGDTEEQRFQNFMRRLAPVIAPLPSQALPPQLVPIQPDIPGVLAKWDVKEPIADPAPTETNRWEGINVIPGNVPDIARNLVTPDEEVPKQLPPRRRKL